MTMGSRDTRSGAVTVGAGPDGFLPVVVLDWNTRRMVWAEALRMTNVLTGFYELLQR
jgi:hypothetical protein